MGEPTSELSRWRALAAAWMRPVLCLLLTAGSISSSAAVAANGGTGSEVGGGPAVGLPCDDDPESLRRQFDSSIRPNRADFGYRAMLRTPESASPYLEILEVRAGSPADRAGLAIGDRIVGIDGPLPPWKHELARVVGLQHYRAGQKIALAIERDGRRFGQVLVPAAMSEQRQEDLVRWVETAARYLAEHGQIYCSEEGISPRAGGSVDSDLGQSDQGSPAWHRLFGRGQRARAILTVERTEDGWSFSTEPAVEIPLDLGLSDLPADLRRGWENWAVGQKTRVALYFGADLEEIRARSSDEPD